jgi:hypothetical protein
MGHFKKSFPFLLAVLATQGCISMPGLSGERSYSSQMEDEEDERYFRPNEDFRVVPGDRGRYWRSPKEIRRRTPASVSMMREEQEQASIDRELSRLEERQSEGAMRHYQRYASRLGTKSEKIYFLQLKGKAEREDYLSARGLLDSAEGGSGELVSGVMAQDLALEMSKTEVISSWGRPDRVDVAGKASYENERWMYTRDGAVKYVYFEGGRVGGWTSQNRAPAAGQNPFE